jgi:uncharacterized protein (TIGR03437 family)
MSSPVEILRDLREGSMNIRSSRFLIIAAGALCRLLDAQTSPAADAPVVITVEAQNSTLYRGDTFDLSKIAKDPGPTTSVNTAFITVFNVGDIRTVNGETVKGIWSYTAQAMPFRANPQPGQPIADVDSAGMLQCIWQIVTADGKYIGTLIDNGAPPSPHHIVTGGAGAFLGMTGIHGAMQNVTPQRAASSSEDPANRRTLGGGTLRTTFYLFPRSRPNVIATPGGPAVTHADGKLVSAASPAAAGEVLTLYATGLGPTTPFIEIGQAFPQGSAYPVNAPVDIKINGQSSEVLYAGGYAGSVDGYQVNFRVPAGMPAGTGSLQLTAAWVPGTPVSIATK